MTTEFEDQKELIQYFRDNWPMLARSIRLSMNGISLGGGRHAAMIINQMKSQGMVKAEADLFFAIPRGPYHGLFIEMKAAGKHATQDQLDYLEYQRFNGYKAAVCYLDEAKKLLTEYIELVNE